MSQSISSVIQVLASWIFEQGKVQSVSEFFHKTCQLTNKDYSDSHKIVQSAIKQIHKLILHVQIKVEIFFESNDRMVLVNNITRYTKNVYKGFCFWLRKYIAKHSSKPFWKQIECRRVDKYKLGGTAFIIEIK